MKKYVFGSYPYDGNRENITWLVLEENGREAKLISECVLDAQAFDDNGGSVWEDSSLREWLQEDFLNMAFTAEQQEALVEVMCKCEQREGQDVVDIDYSFDNVTLLSLDEVREYFPDDDDRIVEATQYAQDEGVELEYAADCCGWWLRSPGVAMLGITGWNACVMANGTLKPWGVYTSSIGVRPVITVDLDLAASCQYDMVEDDGDNEDPIAALERLQELLDRLKELNGDNDEENEENDFSDEQEPLRTITGTIDVNDKISIQLPDGFICEEGLDKDGDFVRYIKAGMYTDDEGNVCWHLNVTVNAEQQMPPDENGILRGGMELIEQGISNSGSENYIKLSGERPLAFVVNKMPLNLAGNVIKFYNLMLVVPWKNGGYASFHVSLNVTHGTEGVRECYELFLELTQAIRFCDQPLSLGGLTVDEMLNKLIPVFEEHEEGVTDVRLELKHNGETFAVVSYGTDGNVTHQVLESLPVTEPQGYLYAHYRQVQPPNTGLPNVTWVINANGTEFAPINIEKCLENKELFELLSIVRDYRERDEYLLAKTARELAEVFRVDMTVFSHQHDRLCEIWAGNLQKCYTFSALRSFAWTLGEMVANNRRNIDDFSTEELLRIVEHAADEVWLNYDASGPFKALCDHPDLHVMYVPDELCSSEHSAALRKGLAQMPTTSLDGFRECLEKLHPAMVKLAEHLGIDRDRLQPLTGNAADVLYAWCALCIAAEEPFISEDGPMMCAWPYPGDQEEYILYRSDGKTPEQRKREKEQKKAKWLEDYGEYISKQPVISIPGKKFVFTGLGMLRDEQKEHPIVQKVIDRGGLYRGSISGVTDYLVVGDDQPGESKIRNAIDQIKAGKPLQIVRLMHLEDALEGRVSVDVAEETEKTDGFETVSADHEVLCEMQEKLNKLQQGLEEMQDAAEQIGELHRQQEEKEKQRDIRLQTARKNAVVNVDIDEACMFAVLYVVDQLGLTDKYGSTQSFFECFGDDFPAYDANTLWQLRCNVDEKRRVKANQDTYTQVFMGLDVETRISLTAKSIVYISPLFDIGKRFDQAVEISAKWFGNSENDAMQAALKNVEDELRENFRSQFSSLCTDWLKWSTAKQLVYVEYSKAPSVYGEEILWQQVGDSIVTMMLRSSNNSVIVSQVMNWYAWYWGIACEEIWLAGYGNRFDSYGEPLKDHYVIDKTSDDDVTAIRLCKALDALGISHQALNVSSYSKPMQTSVAANTVYGQNESVQSTEVQQGSQKEGCYIATAVYGSYDAPEVLVLRRFRDEVLSKTVFGRWFIRVYYRFSPMVAEKLRTAKRLNSVVRRCLNRWVKHLQHNE